MPCWRPPPAAAARSRSDRARPCLCRGLRRRPGGELDRAPRVSARMCLLPGAPPSARGGYSEFTLDLRDRAGFFVEEFVVDLAPAAELADLEEFLRGRELTRVDQFRVDRAVAVFGPDFLAFGRTEEFEEFFRGRLRRRFGDGDRGFDLDRRVGDDVFDVLAFFFG